MRDPVPAPPHSERGAQPSPSPQVPTVRLLTYWVHTSYSEPTCGANANCLLTRAKPTNHCFAWCRVLGCSPRCSPGTRPDTGCSRKQFIWEERAGMEEAGKAARRKGEHGPGPPRASWFLVRQSRCTELCVTDLQTHCVARPVVIYSTGCRRLWGARDPSMCR